MAISCNSSLPSREEDLDVSDGPEISLIGQLSEIQWIALIRHISANISLENENIESILYFNTYIENMQGKTRIVPVHEINSSDFWSFG